MPITIRVATPPDLPAIKILVETAYRGETARVGWTHEADLVTGERIDFADLAQMVEAPQGRLLVATDDDVMRGCVHVADCGNGLAYLGLLCVSPRHQATGLGKRLLAAAESMARSAFAAHRVEMTVIEHRPELIAYYTRRGYRALGERRPFPVPLDPPLDMIVLAKSIDPAQETGR